MSFPCPISLSLSLFLLPLSLRLLPLSPPYQIYRKFIFAGRELYPASGARFFSATRNFRPYARPIFHVHALLPAFRKFFPRRQGMCRPPYTLSFGASRSPGSERIGAFALRPTKFSRCGSRHSTRFRQFPPHANKPTTVKFC